MIGIATTSARAGRPPVAGEQLPLDQQPVGEQRQDQRELDHLDDPLVSTSTETDVGLSEHDPERDREHRDREHRAAHHPRERRGHGEQPAEDQHASPNPICMTALYSVQPAAPGSTSRRSGRRLEAAVGLLVLARVRGFGPGRARCERAEVRLRLRAEEAARAGGGSTRTVK